MDFLKILFNFEALGFRFLFSFLIVLLVIMNLTQSLLSSLNDLVESTGRWSIYTCFAARDTIKTSRHEISFKIMILTFILLGNVVKFRFRKIISEFVNPKLVSFDQKNKRNNRQ